MRLIIILHSYSNFFQILFSGPDDSPTKSCELCCKKPGDGNACTSSFELNQAPLDVPDMFSKAGTPCNNYAGYCDVFQKCREVDPAGKFTFFWGCFRFLKLSFRNNCCHLTEFAGKLRAMEIDLRARSWFARYLNLKLFDIIVKM